ncbi:TIM23 complex component, partial [Gryganskiella cystojenkinii]
SFVNVGMLSQKSDASQDGGATFVNSFNWTLMDTEFFKHIVKNRADPSSNSARNPVPDYYGEKIKSVSEYRKWLRKQREYRRKATFFVGVD